MPSINRRAVRLGALLVATALCAGVLAALLPTPPAGAAVTSVLTNSAPPSDSNGYSWVSYYRGLAGLGEVSRNATMESQERTHLNYLANHALACETNVHDELTSRIGNCGANPYATAAGKAAANNSNITRVSVNVTDRVAVANWFTAAFHALVLLDPRLTSTGYAALYTANPAGAKPLAWNFTAGVDVYRGRQGAYNGATIAFPANNAVTPSLSYTVGTESPEPFRTSVGNCQSWGSKTVVSAPVIVQWPIKTAGAGASGTIVDLTTGHYLSTCTLNAASYPAGSEGRQFLAGANGITKSAFYYAAAPFTPGHHYQLRVGGATITTFAASALPSPVSPKLSGSNSLVTASWASASPGTGLIAHYAPRVYAATNCTGSPIAAVNTPATVAALGGVVRGRYYGIRVASVNAVGASRWSKCIGFRAN